MALFRALFRELGLRLPSSVRAASVRLFWSELCLRLRGLGYVHREAGACSPEALQALVVQRSAFIALSMHASPILAVSVGEDYLLKALSVGEPHHVAVAVGAVAFFLSWARPSSARISRMNEVALEIVERHDLAWLRGSMERNTGCIQVNQGEFSRGREHLVRALELLADRAVRDDSGDHWEVDAAQFYDQVSAFFCGDWLQVARTTPNRIEQGYSRDRIWISVILSGYCGSVAWLAGDDVAGYRRVLRQARASWQSQSGNGPQAQRWPDVYLGLGEVALELYCGAPERAFQLIDDIWRLVPGSLLVPALSVALLFYRGAAALAALRVSRDPVLRGVVRNSVKMLARHDAPHVPPFRKLLQAGLLLQTGDVGGAEEHLRGAVDGFDLSEMRLWAAAARRSLGALVLGVEGRALIAEGDRAMHSRGVVNPDAVTEMLCAGCRAS